MKSWYCWSASPTPPTHQISSRLLQKWEITVDNGYYNGPLQVICFQKYPITRPMYQRPSPPNLDEFGLILWQLCEEKCLKRQFNGHFKRYILIKIFEKGYVVKIMLIMIKCNRFWHDRTSTFREIGVERNRGTHHHHRTSWIC